MDATPEPTIVYQSAVASLVVQLLVGGVTLVGAFLVPTTEPDLRDIFVLELVSQVIEFTWYAVVVWQARRIVTWTRYLDWYVSTPVMLVSMALFFYHRRGVSIDWARGRVGALYTALSMNALMLSAGFAYETHAIPRRPALFVGFVALGVSFGSLARVMDPSDGASVAVFASTAVVWALYGVAAGVLDTASKNVAYNALDVVSKNGYGVFLFGYALTRRSGVR